MVFPPTETFSAAATTTLQWLALAQHANAQADNRKQKNK